MSSVYRIEGQIIWEKDHQYRNYWFNWSKVYESQRRALQALEDLRGNEGEGWTGKMSSGSGIFKKVDRSKLIFRIVHFYKEEIA